MNACSRTDRVEAAREPDAVPDQRNVLTDEDKDFLVYTAEMHTGEIGMAKQAKQKSTNAEVRSYADSVIQSHSDALKRLSREIGSPSNEASWDTRSHMNDLGTMSGSQFDQEFMDLMIADHKSASETFRQEINSVQNKDLKSYLQETLPGLEKGLRDGQHVQAELTGGAKTN